jgi:hypothetical protein
MPDLAWNLLLSVAIGSFYVLEWESSPLAGFLLGMISFLALCRLVP